MDNGLIFPYHVGTVITDGRTG
jgi:hypothetical protein